MSRVSRGNAAERFVAKALEAEGYVVGSRRHIKGPGDILAVHPTRPPRLVEVKEAKDMWQQFRRGDRAEMRELELPPGTERLAVNKRGEELIWYPEKEWP